LTSKPVGSTDRSPTPAWSFHPAVEDRQYRVFYIIRYARAVTGQDLVDIKGIAAGDAVDVFPAVAFFFRPIFRPPAGIRESMQTGERVGGKLAEKVPHRMMGVDLIVTAGKDEETTDL